MGMNKSKAVFCFPIGVLEWTQSSHVLWRGDTVELREAVGNRLQRSTSHVQGY